MNSALLTRSCGTALTPSAIFPMTCVLGETLTSLPAPGEKYLDRSDNPLHDVRHEQGSNWFPSDLKSLKQSPVITMANPWCPSLQRQWHQTLDTEKNTRP